MAFAEGAAGVGTPGTPVEVRGLSLRAGGQWLLCDAAAKFEPGKITLIVGKSGVGKSLLLRVLAGLAGSHPEIEVSGDVRVGEAHGGARRPAVGVVFQGFALFDELSPADNVRLAYAHRPPSAGPAAGDRPGALLEELHVPRRVRTASLSGGQRQRLAIARTLAYQPEVILYDEPTSGLDAVTAGRVARLIQDTHRQHPQTSIIVTHDYEALAPIADAIYLLDPVSKTLLPVERGDWPRLAERLQATSLVKSAPAASALQAPPRPAARLLTGAAECFAASSRAVLAALSLPWRLLPRWPSNLWGTRFFLHYLRLVADPSAWLYVALAGGIAGFVTTYFTFRFLPFRAYTEPLLIENLLAAMGFTLYRILVPVLIGILVAARCGAAVASDVGGKVYGQQCDALRSLGVAPERYLLTGILYAFLLGTPLLTAIGFFAAKLTSLVVFAFTHPHLPHHVWDINFHQELLAPGRLLYRGTWWLLAKMLCCAAGMGLVAYYRGARPKHSTSDISAGITSTILWATLHVLVVNLVFAFYEFD